MVEAAIELVANPVGHGAVREKLRGAGDQIVEIHQTFARLGRFPTQGEGAPRLELRGEKTGEIEQGEPVTDLRDGFGKNFLIGREGRVDLFGARHLARRAVLLEEGVAEAVQPFEPRRRIPARPSFRKIGGFLSGGGLPFARGHRAGPQGPNRKGVVRTGLRHPSRIRIGGNAEQAMDARGHGRLPSVRPGPQILMACAAHQPSAHGIGTLAAAHLGDCGIDPWIAFGQHRGEYVAA